MGRLQNSICIIVIQSYHCDHYSAMIVTVHVCLTSLAALTGIAKQECHNVRRTSKNTHVIMCDFATTYTKKIGVLLPTNT